MSIENVDKFRVAVLRSPRLQGELKEIAASDRCTDQLIALANANGYEFTAEDLESFVADAVKNTLTQDLTQDQALESAIKVFQSRFDRRVTLW